MNSCYLCHLHYVLVCYQTHLHLCICSDLEFNQMSKSRRFVVGTFVVVYEYFPMVWISLFTALNGPTRRPAERR